MIYSEYGWRKAPRTQAAMTKAVGKTADSQPMPNANGSTGAPRDTGKGDEMPMKTGRRILAFCLAVVMMIGLMPMRAEAAEDPTPFAYIATGDVFGRSLSLIGSGGFVDDIAYLYLDGSYVKTLGFGDTYTLTASSGSCYLKCTESKAGKRQNYFAMRYDH